MEVQGNDDDPLIWDECLDPEDPLQQEAVPEAEIMVPEDGEGDSEQAAMIRKYQKASSYQEAIALERCQQKAARKADAFFNAIICDQNASEPSGTPSSYEKAMALERRSEKKHQTVAKPAKSAEECKTCPTNPDVPPRQVKRRKCFKCGEEGHNATQCKAVPLPAL